MCVGCGDPGCDPVVGESQTDTDRGREMFDVPNHRGQGDWTRIRSTGLNTSWHHLPVPVSN